MLIHAVSLNQFTDNPPSSTTAGQHQTIQVGLYIKLYIYIYIRLHRRLTYYRTVALEYCKTIRKNQNYLNTCIGTNNISIPCTHDIRRYYKVVHDGVPVMSLTPFCNLGSRPHLSIRYRTTLTLPPSTALWRQLSACMLRSNFLSPNFAVRYLTVGR